MSSFLFVTDLDNTLIGDDFALATLNGILKKSRETEGTKIVYATGRSLTLYRELTTEKEMLVPDALIAAVGTEIYFDPEDDSFNAQWANWLARNWDREAVLATTAHYSDLVLQPEIEQGAFKVSFYVSEQIATELIPRLQSNLQQRGLAVKLIYSGGKDLDILPAGADKGLAVRFLQRHWNANDEQTVVCGDSGNDIALFSTGEARGIIVGNAKPELREWFSQNQTNYRYLATGRYANGILEGLRHFCFIQQ